MFKNTIMALVLGAVSGWGFAQDSAFPMSSSAKGRDPNMDKVIKIMNDALMMTPVTGNPDRDFLLLLLPHHQGAINMAKVYLKSGKNPKVREMARKTIEMQLKDIQEISDRLEKMR
jgi:uncharacterized protein (DUF305 family)